MNQASGGVQTAFVAGGAASDPPRPPYAGAPARRRYDGAGISILTIVPVSHSVAEEDLLSALLAATARGDRAAFAELYARTSARLFAVLLRMLKQTDWAEEALQDSYMRVWRRSESYAPERGSPMAWLSTIARYRALDLIRMRRAALDDAASGTLNDPEAQADDAPRPDEHAAQHEGLAQLQNCLGALALEQRRSVLLAYYEGYTHAELARRLDAPLGTVKSWVRRGLQQLRACLERG